MRGLGQGLAVMVRRAMTRLVARRDILGLSVAGSDASTLAEMRVLIRLRGRAALDGGALLTLGRNLRRMLHLPPGAGLPLLVMRLAEEGPDLAGADLHRVTGRSWECQWPDRQVSLAARPVASQSDDVFGLLVTLQQKRRRSRSPPSPWSVSLSACG